MLSGFILDSSISLSWCFKDEETAESLAMFQLASQSHLVVPALWHVEMTNILGMALKTNRITRAAVDAILANLATLEIETVPNLVLGQSRRIHDLMSLYGLTAYDAGYLNLALSLGLPLATFDRKLALAAQAAGVKVIVAPTG